MLLFIQIISVMASVAGVVGFFTDTLWLLIAGAVVGFLTYMDGPSNMAANKLTGLMGATAGMFIVHFAFDQAWGVSYVLSLSVVSLITGVIGLAAMIKDPDRR